MEYNKYSLSKKDQLKLIVMTLFISAGISLLFYRSTWGMLLFPVVGILVKKRMRAHSLEKRKRSLMEQFMDALRVVHICLMSGMSMENTWKEAEQEIHLMHGTESLLYQELTEMNRLIASNEPMEKVLSNFAYRTGMEDIISFAEAFEYGKRSGVNWRKLISDLVLRMEEKYEMEKQIQVMLAEKKMEQQIMSVIPLFMILFLQISSGEYMNVLYHNPLGIGCMTVCLIGYTAALYLAERIIKIQV